MEKGRSRRRTSPVFLILLWIVMFSAASLLLATLFISYFLAPSVQSFSSLDWSGYVVNSDYTNPQPMVTSVNGSWVVPSVTVTPEDAFSAAWVGIGGQTDNTLIQIGTEHDSIGGTAEYSAWYELLPNDSITINQLTVSPGDKITASIELINSIENSWLMQINDITENQSYSINVFYDSSQLSGEWILERPTIGNSIGTLSDFGSITFTDMAATINTTTGTASSFPHSEITMSDRHGNALVSVSSLSNNGTTFTVTYLSVSSRIQTQIDELLEIEASGAVRYKGRQQRLSKRLSFLVGVGNSFTG